MDLKEKIRSIPDFPVKGVLFRDITTLLKDKEGYHELIDRMHQRGFVTRGIGRDEQRVDAITDP